MQITKREFLRKLGLVGAAGVTGAALGDQVPADAGTARRFYVRDEDDWGVRRVFDVPHSMTDGPSAFLRDGKVYRPMCEGPVFHETDTVAWAGDGGSGYGIAVPYRQLLPKKVENLLCCGRMLGAPDTIETLRLITPCMTTGEAANVYLG